MSVDNRTIINDCEATTGWTGDDAVTAQTGTGAFYEGSTSLSWQASNADEQMHTTQDSVGAGTFSVDWSDSTLYLLVKDNLGNTAANGGVQFVIGDGTDLIGYDVGGNDAAGVLLPTYFQSYKLDVSVVVTTPGAFTNFAGTEANLDQTACTQIGYGSLHLAKAAGPSDNVFMDCFRYIANDSYALTINGGTAGTPETMADVQGDDVTNGWGMVGNPIGSQYLFFAPTEWGNASTIAEHAFAASNEQWYWLGDNGGGHAVGAGHFIFRVTANATDAGSFIATNVVIVNTGTGANFDCSNADIDVLEIDGCTMVGLATFVGPVAGGTSRFVTDTKFLQCGTVTHSGASMNGSSISDSAVSADTGALYYNTNSDPNGEMDNMLFVAHATVLHHALEFGTTAPLTMTLTGWTTEDFSASDAVNNSTFLFPDRGSDVTWTVNIVDGTGNFSYKKLRATDTVVISVSVGVQIKVQDQATDPIENVRISMYLTSDDSEILNADSNASGITAGSFSGTTPASIYWRARKGSAADSPKYIARSGVGTVTSGGFDLLVTMQENPNNNA